jgi:hypothetical protein
MLLIGHWQRGSDWLLCGDYFIKADTRHRPKAGTHGGQLSGNRNIFTIEVP